VIAGVSPRRAATAGFEPAPSLPYHAISSPLILDSKALYPLSYAAKKTLGLSSSDHRERLGLLASATRHCFPLPLVTVRNMFMGERLAGFDQAC
jgi:hypothetical protein